MEKLADFLVAAAPGYLDMVYFVSGGSEGVEAALKMARQYFLRSARRSGTRSLAGGQAFPATTPARWTWGAMRGGPDSFSRFMLAPNREDVGLGKQRTVVLKP